MKRREFITLLGSTAVGWSLAASAQTQAKIPRVGCDFPNTPMASKHHMEAFRQALKSWATRVYWDKSLPAERRIEAGKAALFGPKSNPGPDDVTLDGASADTIKAQISASDPKVFPLEAWWPGGKAPMLVIQGLEDVVAPPENGRSLKADYPDRVTLVEFPDLGHAVLRERPDLTAETITTFVRKLVR